MWPSIRRWRDWAIPELAESVCGRMEVAPVRVNSEIGGLILDKQPIPWNADSVIVEWHLRLPDAARSKSNFVLRLLTGDRIAADAVQPEGSDDRHRVRFRFRPPEKSTAGDLLWRDRVQGRFDLRILSKHEFLEFLNVEMPTLHARIGDESVDCRAFLASQCSGLSVCGLLTSPTNFAPLHEMQIRLQVRGGNGEVVSEINTPMSKVQLLHRRALIAAHPRKWPKHSGPWKISWLVESHELATIDAKAIVPRAFRRSLRLVGARFIVDDGTGPTIRWQLSGHEKSFMMAPCFLVASTEPGMAAWTDFEIKTIGREEATSQIRVLVTDGPTPVVGPIRDHSTRANVQSFELMHRGRCIGSLPLRPAPEARVTAEGGFITPPDFAWTPAAEEELWDRLTKLIK